MNTKLVFYAIAVLVAMVSFYIVYMQYTQPPEGNGSHTYRLHNLQPDASYAPSTPHSFSFTIGDEQGNTLTDFALTHTKRLHLIVVRTDLAYFQHLHPEYDAATGTFSLEGLTFPGPGMYRIFADFAPTGAVETHDDGDAHSMEKMEGMTAADMPQSVVVFEDVAVGEGVTTDASYAHTALNAAEANKGAKTFSGLGISLTTHATPRAGEANMLMYGIKKNGVPVTDLEPYLGALGHAVILREGTLDFIHAHPLQDAASAQTGSVDFMVTFPKQGNYKVFTQLQRGGAVVTTDFVVSVEGGASRIDTSKDTDMHDMHM
jgi:hypothetical protein